MPQPAAPLAVTTKSSAEPSAPLPQSQPSFKAQENIGARCTPTSNGSSSSNVLYAVIALLGDLDERSLRLVRAEASTCVSSPQMQHVNTALQRANCCRHLSLSKSCTCLAD